MRVARIALPLCLALVLGAAPVLWIAGAAAAEGDESEAVADRTAAEEAPTPTIYKWIDEHGVAHYTTDRDQIPGELRNRIGKLGPPDAAMRRTPVEPSAPPIPSRSVSDFDEAERWAVRDRAFERSAGSWDEGDPYGSLPGSDVGQAETVVSAREQEERRQRLEEIDERIALLETDIAANEEALKALLVVPIPEGGGPLVMADDPTFREVADRLPELLSDLRALEDERAQLQAP
jgi:hypothetical protein